MNETTILWQEALQACARAEKAVVLQRFFKTGPGEYGEGDRFIGVMVPDSRRVAKTFVAAPLAVVDEMLCSAVHEHRLSALLALVERYRRADNATRAEICRFYLARTARINNWDLVDLSAPKIVGAEALRTDSLATLRRLAASSAMWEQRIAVVSTLTLIRADRLADALAIVEPLLYHSHDLMRKANGWMLREVGKRNLAVLTGVLDRLAPSLPRTTLRYAIERLDPVSRKHYMSLRFSEPVLDI